MTTLQQLEAVVAALNMRVAVLEGTVATLARGGKPASGGPILVASDADLDGQYGDPEIRRDPPKWKGPSYVGRTYSACPADYLRDLAGFLDWGAGKDEETGYTDSKGRATAPYKRKDASRARGWAARVEQGGSGPSQPTLPRTQEDHDDDLPF